MGSVYFKCVIYNNGYLKEQQILGKVLSEEDGFVVVGYYDKDKKEDVTVALREGQYQETPFLLEWY